MKIFFLFLFSIQMCWGQANLPPQPVNTCAPSDVPCNTTYNTVTLPQWEANKKIWEQMNSTAISNDGKLTLPIAPVNNCVLGSPGYTTCEANYNADYTAYQQAVARYNSLNTQTATTFATQTQELQQQQSTQDADKIRLSTPTNVNSTSAMMQEVQKNSLVAADMYTTSSTYLSQYASHYGTMGNLGNMACTTSNYAACEDAAAGYAASSAYSTLNLEANAVITTLSDSVQEACRIQNSVSAQQVNCNTADPSSQIHIPAVGAPPNPSWFDPITGLCTASAPALCNQVLVTGTAGGAQLASFPKETKFCADGTTRCITEVTKYSVYQTPYGTKHVFKSTTKTGKDFSYYAKDLKDEKSMIKAGLSPAQAKKLKAELDTNVAKIQQVAAAAVGKVLDPNIKLLSLEKIDEAVEKKLNTIESDSAKKLISAIEQNVAKLNLQQAQSRLPSSEGLSKEVNGDLIGVRSENIFKMIRRRYEYQSKQSKFIVP